MGVRYIEHVDTSDQQDLWDVCRSLCAPEIVAALERTARDPEHEAVIAVLRECQRVNHAGLRMVLAELNGCRGNPAALGSLLSEVCQYHQEPFRKEVMKYVAEDNKVNLTYGRVLSEWLELYQMWCRAIT